jgi:hypothetical protein
MIALEVASIAISVAKGVIKLAGRIDRLTAEKEAVKGTAIIPMPPVRILDVDHALTQLREYLVKTAHTEPDPLGQDRPELEALLAQNPVPKGWFKFYERLFPEEAHRPDLRPDAEYLKALQRWVPSINWNAKTNTEVCKAAFYIAAGRDERGLGYGSRLGLLVADVIMEFGAEQTALFVRDQNAQKIVQSVLQRFSKPDLENFEEWSPFLHQALSSTLNGLLDARVVFDGHAQWADALIDALARTRDQVADSDDYLLGLLRGRGYSLLLGEGLKVASETLTSEHRGPFRDIVTDLLRTAAPLVQENEADFGTFFRQHWGDLVRGGLSALGRHGPQLLEGQTPLLQQTLLAVVKQLAETRSTAYFSSDTVLHLAEAALGAVARNPELLDGSVGEEWLRRLISSVTSTIHDSSVREVFSQDGLERIFKNTLATFASYPELIVERPGLAREVVAEVLRAVAETRGLQVWPLANAAVSGALRGLARHPELAGSQFGPHVAELAGTLAQRIKDQSLESWQATALIDAAIEAVLRNPSLFAAGEQNIARAVLQAIMESATTTNHGTVSQNKLLLGTTLVQVASEVLAVIARYGTSFIEKHNVKTLAERVTEVLTAGLNRGAKEIGRRMDQTALPEVLALLVSKLLRGELADLDPESETFKKLFSEIAETVAT